jgi:hypothetical protein
MIDRYVRDALACYGRLRRLGPAEARAELESFDCLLVMAGRRVEEAPTSCVRRGAGRASPAGRSRARPHQSEPRR